MSQGGRDDRSGRTDRQQGPNRQGRGQSDTAPSSDGPRGPNQSDATRRSAPSQTGQRQQPPPGGPNQGPQAGGSGTSPAQKVGIILIGAVLLFTLSGANISMAADRTVLSSDYVIETMDEERVFADVARDFQDDVADDIDSSTASLDLPPGLDVSGIDGSEVAQGAVTEQFVRSEVSGNIDRLYEYLNDERDNLEFVVNIQPVKESIRSDIVEGTVIDTPTLVGEATDRIDTETVAALGESRQSYQQTQEEFEISSSEATALRQEAEAQASQSSQPDSITDPALQIQFAVIDALAGEISFDEYTSRIENQEQTLKEAIATEGLADVDDQIQLGNEDEDPTETFGSAATAVQWLSTFTWLLPVLSLVLIGIIAAITRSFDRTAMPAGIAVILAGVIGMIVSFGLRDTLLSRVEQAATDGDTSETSSFIDGLLGAIEGVLDTLGTQSILLVVLGIVLVGLAYADRNAYLDDVRETLGLDPVASQTAPRRGQGRPPQQSPGGQAAQQPPGQQPPRQPPQQQPPGGQPGQQPPGGQPGQQPPAESGATPSGDTPSEDPEGAVGDEKQGAIDDSPGEPADETADQPEADTDDTEDDRTEQPDDDERPDSER